jgi:hypothetical protein
MLFWIIEGEKESFGTNLFFLGVSVLEILDLLSGDFSPFYDF